MVSQSQIPTAQFKSPISQKRGTKKIKFLVDQKKIKYLNTKLKIVVTKKKYNKQKYQKNKSTTKQPCIVCIY